MSFTKPLGPEIASLTPQALSSIQRAAGNQAVARLVSSRRPPAARSLAGSSGLVAATVPFAPAGSVTVQRRTSHVGAVEEGYSLQDTEGGAGSTPGSWHAPEEGGYSRLMEGAAGEMTESMADSGQLSSLMLRQVAPDLSGIPAAEGKWLAYADEAKEEIDSWTFGFAPGSIRTLYQDQFDSANRQVATIKLTAEELTQRAATFNSFVPQGNAFHVSAARLSSMQALLGATDNDSLAAALTGGLLDASDVMERYREAYDDLDRRKTTEKLDEPKADESVEQAVLELKDASRNVDAKYLGFRATVLSGEIGSIKSEYAGDEARLEEINEVKKFVRDVGKTVDVTMSVVRGAPTAVANVTASVRKGKAMVNAQRNRRDILAGKRERYNPTYVTADKDGNMVVRNMQTGLDRDALTGEKSAIPDTEGISLPTSVSEVLGTITDFAYYSEVEEINRRLQQMRTRIGAVKAAIDASLFEQKILEYQNALNEFATKAAALQARMEDRREAYRDFGKQLDRFANVDKASERAGQEVAKGAERYTTIMTVVAAVQEMIALGTKSQGSAPTGIPEWWATVRKRRFSQPTEGEVSTVTQIHGQIVGFKNQVSSAQQLFSSVSSQAESLVGRY